MTDEITRRKAAVAEGRTDVTRWHDPASYENFWADRARAAAALATDAGWVCDIGCGMQRLAEFLPKDTHYLPADLRAWTEKVEACDLNARRYPERSLLLTDLTYLLGVIEYINDVPRLFADLARRTPLLVVSYNVPELAPAVDRPGYGWVNALSAEALAGLLQDNGFVVESRQRSGTMEVLLRARSNRYPAARRWRRAIARLRG